MCAVTTQLPSMGLDVGALWPPCHPGRRRRTPPQSPASHASRAADPQQIPSISLVGKASLQAGAGWAGAGAGAGIRPGLCNNCAAAVQVPLPTRPVPAICRAAQPVPASTMMWVIAYQVVPQEAAQHQGEQRVGDGLRRKGWRRVGDGLGRHRRCTHAAAPTLATLCRAALRPGPHLCAHQHTCQPQSPAAG